MRALRRSDDLLYFVVRFTPVSKPHPISNGPLPDLHSKPAAARDIHERSVSEQDVDELRLRIEQQSRILDITLSSISDFAYMFDREGRFAFVNEALLKLWGLKIEDAVGKNFYELKYPDELASRL